MAFYMNIGYRFSCPDTVMPDGSAILCSAMPMHQLERRRLNSSYPHMATRIFDPQLYMAGLDASQCAKHCAKMASYPWFGVTGLQTFNSGVQSQSQWTAAAIRDIPRHWTGAPPSDPTVIAEAVRECLEFQRRIGCEFAIVPSPLTSDPATSYTDELVWLDAAITYASSADDFDLPLYATLAFSDICVLYADPQNNPFLDLVADAISAREIEGVYLVVEQGSEPLDTRLCGNTRTLRSVLHVIHMLAQDASLKVAVNFLGAFGLACEGAGASIWVDEWYKSLHRLRLADKLSGGRAYPSLWSYPGAVDINLDTEFDILNQQGFLAQIRDDTFASQGLLTAASSGVPVSSVPAWQYRSANVSTAIEHYLLSCIQAEGIHNAFGVGTTRLDGIQAWLANAVGTAAQLDVALGAARKTKTNHVIAWDEAFRLYRADHSL